jgi:lipopolysaccharide/colanic/teichoic acid biosynthesis glycosyltransferase
MTGRRYDPLKRLVDLTITIPALILLSPVMAVLGLLVRNSPDGPVLFRQERPGRDGKPFTILKFRTMDGSRDVEGRLLPDGQRLTRLGRTLRRTSLDELPELFNVLKGDMSLVGPRPLLMQYLDRYSPEQHRRHEVRPGITGWTQVNGRNAVAWDERFALDVWYVDNRSFLLDCRILFLTLWKVVTREGIDFPGAVPVEFMGPERKPANTDALREGGGPDA